MALAIEEGGVSLQLALDVAETIVGLRAEKYDASHKASGLNKTIKDRLSELRDIMMKLGIEELVSTDGMTTFSLEASARRTPKGQPKLGSQFRDVAECVLECQVALDGCFEATALNQGQARDLLDELATGFGTKAVACAVEEIVEDLLGGAKHHNQHDRLRQLTANWAKQLGKNGKAPAGKALGKGSKA